LALALTLLGACKDNRAAGGRERPTPSGLPVPRYVSLKFDEVNARGGPGDDYRLLWVYRARGLPVQVVAETQDWRRVCDPWGGLAWVKATGVDGRRTVMRLKPPPVPLMSKPDARSKVSAYLAPRAAAYLGKCGGGWCRLKTPEASGWAQADTLWGADERPQCR